MESRPRAGQARGGELFAIAMAAARVVFVAVEARRTPRDVGGQSPSEQATADTVAAPSQPAVASDSLALQRPSTPAALARAELRRRIEVGSTGTYLADMLADRDSLLTRWPERTADPVRVWIQRRPSVLESAELFRVARAAFTDWSEVGIPLRFTFTVDSTSSEIRIGFAGRIEGENRLGVTTHRHSQEGWIVGADVTIATHDTSGAALPSSLVAAIARHEVGHALGLAHSRDRTTIMYPESQTMSIGPADRATLRLLYSLPAGSVK
jgi:hypothetical protein